MKNKWIELATFLLMTATVIAGFLTTTDVNLLPPEWLPYLPLAIGGITILKQLAYGALDLLDDGVLNKSYKTPTTLLRVMAVLCFPFWLLCCAGPNSTDKELARAVQSVEVAQFSFELAQVVYGARLTDPTTSPAERLVAQKIIEEARKRLADEKSRLEAIQARRAAALTLPQGGPLTPATPLLLPPLTEAK